MIRLYVFTFVVLFMAGCNKSSGHGASQQNDNSDLDQIAENLEREGAPAFEEKVRAFYKTSEALRSQSASIMAIRQDFHGRYPELAKKWADGRGRSKDEVQALIFELTPDADIGENMAFQLRDLTYRINSARVDLMGTIYAREVRCVHGPTEEQLVGARDANYIDRKFIEICSQKLANFKIAKNILTGRDGEQNIKLCQQREQSSTNPDLSLEVTSCRAAENIKVAMDQIKQDNPDIQKEYGVLRDALNGIKFNLKLHNE